MKETYLMNPEIFLTYLLTLLFQNQNSLFTSHRGAENLRVTHFCMF